MSRSRYLILKLKKSKKEFSALKIFNFNYQGVSVCFVLSNKNKVLSYKQKRK